MYRISLDGKTLFNPNLENFKIFNPIIELEQNNISTFTFSIDDSNDRFKEIRIHKSIVEVYNDDLLFYGRVVEIEDDNLTGHKVFCVGALGYLCDTIIDAYSYEGSVRGLLEKFVNEHNKQVEPDKKFVVGKVTVTDPNNYIVRADSNYSTTWKSIKTKLLDMLGGYIFLRISNGIKFIDYLEELPYVDLQKIEFGKNLISVKKNKSYADICTVIKPLGKKDENGNRLTIKSINNGVDYLEDLDAIKKFGRITKTVFFDDVTTPSNLLNKGKKALGDAIKMTYSITINAIDLGSNFNINRKIGVISKFHNIDDYFIPMKIKINLFRQSENKIELNDTRKTLTDDNNDLFINGDTILNIIENVKSDYEINVPKKLTELTNELTSVINQTSKEIKLEVSNKYYEKGDVNKLISNMDTKITQTDKNIRFDINKEITEATSKNAADIKKFSTYFDFSQSGLTIGKRDSGTKLGLINDEVAFMQDGVKTAYWKNKIFYVDNGSFNERLTIGDFAFLPQKDGKLLFKKVK